MSTLYASFIDASAAEKAAGALLDQGAASSDISIVANESFLANQAKEASDAEGSAKKGISTTTAADAGAGALKGASIGLGVGALAVIASVIVPGFGVIVGGGAMALALAGGAATVVAGGAAGAVVGYLKDQGVPEEVATRYSTDFVEGGAILAISVPSGTLMTTEIESTLSKYGATNVATYYSNKVILDDPNMQVPKVPLVVDNPSIDPIAVTPVAAVEVEPAPKMTRIVDAATGEERIVTSDVRTVVVDPVSGEPVVPIPAEEEIIVAKRDDVNVY